MGKKTRAVKVAAKKEEPKPAATATYALLEPTYTTYVTPTPTYQVVPQAPPVEIVQPVTYAAPVTSSVVMPAVEMVRAAPAVTYAAPLGGSVQMAPAMAMEAPMVIR